LYSFGNRAAVDLSDPHTCGNLAAYAHDEEKVFTGPSLFVHKAGSCVALHADVQPAVNVMFYGESDVWKFVSYPQWRKAFAQHDNLWTKLRGFELRVEAMDVDFICVARGCGEQISFVRDWHQVEVPSKAAAKVYKCKVCFVFLHWTHDNDCCVTDVICCTHFNVSLRLARKYIARGNTCHSTMLLVVCSGQLMQCNI
jgi:hypothetical protein